MNLKNKLVFVTGGAGFIGSHIVQRLCEMKAKVIVYDDFSTGKRANLKGLNVTIADDLSTFADWFKEGSILFHIAGSSSLHETEYIPARSISNELILTSKLLYCCKDKKVDHIVFASTGSVYGIPQILPISEQHPTNPTSIYGINKLAAEQYINLWRKRTNGNYINLRLFSIYGERQRLMGVIPTFIYRALNNELLQIEGDGLQTRAPLYIDDCIEWIFRLVENESAWNDTFNLGGEDRKILTIQDLVDLILKQTQKKDLYEYVEGRLGDIKHLYGSTFKVRSKTKYVPQVGIGEGLRKMVKWMRRK